jgi:Flp pilus assembly protein TadG
MNDLKEHIHSQRGQSLVEFAFALVLLFIILAGLVDAARAIFTYLSMRDGAQDAALYASIQPTDTTGIQARACNSSNLMTDLCNDPDANERATVTVNLLGAACAGEGVEVTVTVAQFPLVMPFIGTFVGNQWVPITARVVDTILTPPCP